MIPKLKWSRKTEFKAGDYIMVSKYFTRQEEDELVTFKVDHIIAPYEVTNDRYRGLNSDLLKAFIVNGYNDHHYSSKKIPFFFTTTRSLDVFSARVIATYPEYYKFMIKAKWNVFRKSLARFIYPEGEF